MSAGGPPRVGVLAVVWDGERVLLVRRANPPEAGHWGFPGGHLERGESLRAGAARELYEETGVRGRPRSLLTAVELIADSRGTDAHFILMPVHMTYLSGVPTARSDALDTRWFAPESLPGPLCTFVVDVVRESRPHA